METQNFLSPAPVATGVGIYEAPAPIRYSDADLQEFKILILSKLEQARENLSELIISQSNENGTDDTSPSWKTVEEGGHTQSIEENGTLISRQEKYIKHLEAALDRIENKTYGICRETGQLIPKERLRAVPHATLCIEVKK